MCYINTHNCCRCSQLSYAAVSKKASHAPRRQLAHPYNPAHPHNTPSASAPTYTHLSFLYKRCVPYLDTSRYNVTFFTSKKSTGNWPSLVSSVCRSCAWRTPCWTTSVLPLRQRVPCARVVIFEPPPCTASQMICCLCTRLQNSVSTPRRENWTPNGSDRIL